MTKFATHNSAKKMKNFQTSTQKIALQSIFLLFNVKNCNANNIIAMQKQQFAMQDFAIETQNWFKLSLKCKKIFLKIQRKLTKFSLNLLRIHHRNVRKHIYTRIEFLLCNLMLSIASLRFELHASGSFEFWVSKKSVCNANIFLHS